MKRHLASVLFGAALASGCGSTERAEPGGSSALAFEIPPGVTVSSATYVVTGPGGFSSAGTVPVGDSPDVSVVLSGLPVGAGYQIDLDATASDQVTHCTGSTDFAVPTASPVTVVVHLECGVPSGDITVTATTNICTRLDTLDVLPTETRIGGHLSLSASAHDSDDGPSAIAYRWLANGRVIAGQTAPTFTFTCTSPGNVTLAVSATDGTACEDHLQVTVTCSP